MKLFSISTTKFLVAFTAFAAASVAQMVPNTSAYAQSGGGWAVYSNCRAPFNGVQCTIGVADAYYARQGSARANEGWTRISSVYNTGVEAWRIACRRHYTRNSYASPDIVYGKINCSRL